MAQDYKSGVLEAFVRTFPALNIALNIRDTLCWILKKIYQRLLSILTWLYKLLWNILTRLASYLGALFPARARYQLLDRLKVFPVPYRNKPLKRFLTYHMGLLLGLSLYIFVYIVLIKHSSLLSLTIAFIVLIIYMVLLENSHTFRSILMLSLPIMFSNRGRALIYCVMIHSTLTGPVHNTKINVEKLYSSYKCSQGYLVVQADKRLEKDAIPDLVKLEDLMVNIIDQIREFSDELRVKFNYIVKIAAQVDDYIVRAMDEILRIVDLCNNSTDPQQDGISKKCRERINLAYQDCRSKLPKGVDSLCEIVRPISDICDGLQMGKTICEIPHSIIAYLDEKIGKKLKAVTLMIENELYFDANMIHEYSYQGNKSKSYKEVSAEILFDVDQKFWYFHFISRVFNLLSLIIVCWILITATLYHMNFLRDIKFDNMYLDKWLDRTERRRLDRLEEQQERRRRRLIEAVEQDRDLMDVHDHYSLDNPTTGPSMKSINSLDSIESLEVPVDEEPEDDNYLDDERVRSRNGTGSSHQITTIYPMSQSQRAKYLEPFSFHMNHEEIHKLKLATIVWLIISGYCFFFISLDFSLFELIQFGAGLLDDTLFKSDLPLIQVDSDTTNALNQTEVTHFNRTELRKLRDERLASFRIADQAPRGNMSLVGLYRNLIKRIETSIPDEVVILDSLESCLPSPAEPNFHVYKHLVRLAALTMVIVFIEAYALRTRHCIANLYFPYRAKQRALWLYRQIINEKGRYKDDDEAQRRQEPTKKDRFFGAFIDWLSKAVKRT